MGQRQLTVENALHDQTNILPKKELIIAFAALSFATMVNYVDQNGISVTLPTIASDIDAQNTISWAGTASLIANTTFQMLYGRLSDIFGRKAVYLCAIGLLAISDLLCGLSRNATMFYIFRGCAGIGSGGISNLMTIIVSDIVTLEQRGKYQGFIGAAVGLGNVIGPFLAAVLTETTTWRAFFYALAPLGAACGLVSYVVLPSNAPKTTFREGAKSIDYIGALTSTISVAFLLIPISGGGDYFAWGSPMIISMLAIGTCFFLLFLIIEWKAAILPMMPVQIFKSPEVSTMLTQTFLLGAVYQSYLYYLPLYFQNVRGYTAVESAAIQSSLVIAQSFASVCAGQYISRFKRYGEVVWFGFGLWTLGTGLACVFNRATHLAAIVVVLVVIGIGVGSHSPKARRSVIISSRNFLRGAGGAFGLAISAAVLQASLRNSLPSEYRYLASSTYSPPQLTGPGRDIVLDAYMTASRNIFIMQAPMMALCLIGCAVVKDKGLEPSDERAAREAVASTTLAENIELSTSRTATNSRQELAFLDTADATRKGSVKAKV
ncbi:MFS general substrate transporter [Thozetella sp. PMI_491]|nr:MFS general substrate transporter [Thozetella sp. PMI_491]